MSQLNFIPAQWREQNAAIPEGDYLAQAVTEIVKASVKNANNFFIETTLQIIEGPHKGKSVVDRINVQNSSAFATKTGLRKLADFCDGIGIAVLTDSAELLNRPIGITIAFETDRASGEITDRNIITRYFPANALVKTPEPPTGVVLGATPSPAAPVPNLSPQLGAKNVALGRPVQSTSFLDDDASFGPPNA